MASVAVTDRGESVSPSYPDTVASFAPLALGHVNILKSCEIGSDSPNIYSVRVYGIEAC